mmetsp:Transcript_66677/g.144816  ORF Transcript_66677/g.144816 Transcript_66677/m.144816 type:complete len:224 (-) Transcript_66677:608-1279(-)
MWLGSASWRFERPNLRAEAPSGAAAGAHGVPMVLAADPRNPDTGKCQALRSFLFLREPQPWVAVEGQIQLLMEARWQICKRDRKKLLLPPRDIFTSSDDSARHTIGLVWLRSTSAASTADCSATAWRARSGKAMRGTCLVLCRASGLWRLRGELPTTHSCSSLPTPLSEASSPSSASQQRGVAGHALGRGLSQLLLFVPTSIGCAAVGPCLPRSQFKDEPGLR